MTEVRKPDKRPELQVVTAMYESFAASLPRLANLPRVHRFTVGERLESLQMDVLECLLHARFERSKSEWLNRANIKLDLCRMLVRALCDSKQISPGLYEAWILELDGVGRQVGGWIRQTGARPSPPAGGDHGADA